MGFFKKIGTKLKRFASLANVKRALKGDFVGIADDGLRIIKTEKQKKTDNAEPTIYKPDNTFAWQNLAVPSIVNDYLKVTGNDFSNKVVSLTGKNATVQKIADDGTSFLSKVYLQAMWLKHKNLILSICGVLVAFLVYWFGFRKKPRRGRYGR